MTLYIFECEKCKHLIKHSLEKPVGGLYICSCPKCKVNNRFKFLRLGDPDKDWFSKIIQIPNERRRPGDKLHSTEARKERKP